MAVPAVGVRFQRRTPQEAVRWLAIGGATLILLAMASLLAVTSADGARGGQARASDHASSSSHDTHGAQPLAVQPVAALLPAAAQQSQPVEASDRDLLERVRLAGLWEMPAGEMAVEKGRSDRVREIGEMISTQHEQLDQLVVTAAEQLNVTLPDEPNADQQAWLAEMEEAEGAEFDRIFVDRLRDAHGVVFPAIAQVRANTKNDVVRQLATEANGFVLNHLSYLESTELVAWDYERGSAAAQASSSESAGSGIDLGMPVLWAGLALAVVAGGIGSGRLLRSR